MYMCTYTYIFFTNLLCLPLFHCSRVTLPLTVEEVSKQEAETRAVPMTPLTYIPNLSNRQSLILHYFFHFILYAF